MARTKTHSLKQLGNENSYTNEFFEELYQKIELTNAHSKTDLKYTIILAAQSYMRYYDEYLRQFAAHEIEKELKKVVNHIDKAANSFVKVCSSGNYGTDIANNLHDVISENHPALHGILTRIRSGDGTAISKTSPLGSLPLLEAMADGLERTIKNFPSRKTTPKSMALYHWMTILSAKLEPILDRKLEQSHYYQGEYISKKKISDSELLLSIIEPLDPNVTISQIETVIKETRKERHERTL